MDNTCRKILADAALKGDPTVVDIKRAICLIEHRLSHSRGQDHFLINGLVLLLASIFERLSSTMSCADIFALKEYVFVHSEIIKTNMMSDSLLGVVRDGKFDGVVFRITVDGSSLAYHRLVKIALDPRSEDDRMLASDISGHWLQAIKTTASIDITEDWVGYSLYALRLMCLNFDGFRSLPSPSGQSFFIHRISSISWTRLEPVSK